MAGMRASDYDIEEVRQVFGGSAKIPRDCVAALRSDDTRTFAMTGPGAWSKGQMGGLNDNVDRLWVAEGWELILYKDHGLTGYSQKFHCPSRGRLDRNHTSLLGDTQIWNFPEMEGTSSCELRYFGYTATQVAVCWSGDMGSRSRAITFIPGEYSDLPDWADDDFNYIYVPEDVKVFAYSTSRFRDKEYHLTPGTHRLDDIDAKNAIGSLKVILPDWELVKKEMLWGRAKERALDRVIVGAPMRNYGCGELGASFEFEDSEGSEHSIEWHVGGEVSVTTGASVEVSSGVVTGNVYAESTVSVNSDYGESENQSRSRAMSAAVEYSCPPHSGARVEAIIHRSELSLPVRETWRDPDTGRISVRQYDVKSKRGIRSEPNAYPLPLNGKIGTCPHCGQEGVRLG